MKDSIDIAFTNATHNTTGSIQYMLWNATLMEDRRLRLPQTDANQANRDTNIQLSPDRALAIVVPNHMRFMLDTRLYDEVIQAFYDELNEIMGQDNANRIMISCFTREVIDDFNEQRSRHGVEAICPRLPDTESLAES